MEAEVKQVGLVEVVEVQQADLELPEQPVVETEGTVDLPDRSLHGYMRLEVLGQFRTA